MSRANRRDFIFRLFGAPFLSFGIFSIFGCEAESDSEGESLYLPPNNTDYQNGQPVASNPTSNTDNSKPNPQPNPTASKPQRGPFSTSQPKISVLDDLKNRVGNAQIEITYDEDGDPYVKSIAGVGSECLYFTVNGKQFLGDEVHAANVYFDPENDVVEWYCNGQLLDI